MKFIKNLFSKPEPEEVIREKLLELELPDHAIYLPEAIDEEDNFNLVREVTDNLIDQGKFNGRLVGRKGWFLPDAKKKLAQVWENLEKHKINLEEVGKTWKINEKRVFIALQDHAETLNLEEPVFHRDEMDVYLVSYFKKAWYDILAAYDEDHEAEFDKLVKNAKIKPESRSIFEELVRSWLEDESGRYALGADGMIRPKSIVPELIEELIPELWEKGQGQVTYEELAEKYGMTRKEIGGILQKLIDDRALGEVTLYATDEMIKPRI